MPPAAGAVPSVACEQPGRKRGGSHSVSSLAVTSSPPGKLHRGRSHTGTSSGMYFASILRHVPRSGSSRRSLAEVPAVVGVAGDVVQGLPPRAWLLLADAVQRSSCAYGWTW